MTGMANCKSVNLDSTQIARRARRLGRKPAPLESTTDRRVNNGRKPRDLSAMVNTVIRGRTVVDVEWRPNGTARAQFLVLKCPCGKVARMPPSQAACSRACRVCCPRSATSGKLVPAPRKPDMRRRNFSKAPPVSNLAAYTVCACAWFNGRLVRACQQHAARGAA